ncbi:MAG: MTH1187 family thiamine-binding protein [Planctomycetota bacterium]
MLLAEFSIWPMDKGVSVGEHVAKALDIVERSGLAYKVGPLGTCVEGEYDQVMGVIRECHELLSAESDRVMCTVKMDWRRGKTGRIEGKVASVEKHLGRTLNK